jgi:hypothetical protein
MRPGNFSMTPRLLGSAALVLAGVVPISAPAALAQPAGIDPHAVKLLKASTDYLASQKQYRVDARTTIEVVLKTGQKLQFDAAASLALERPNKLRGERRGTLVDQIFYYDGKSLALYNPGQRYYATVAAPDTLEAMLDFARTKLDIEAPAGDLLYVNAFDIVMDGVTSAFVVGKGGDRGRALRPSSLPRRGRRLADLDPGGQPAAAAQVPHHLARNRRGARVLGRHDQVEPHAEVL